MQTNSRGDDDVVAVAPTIAAASSLFLPAPAQLRDTGEDERGTREDDCGATSHAAAVRGEAITPGPLTLLLRHPAQHTGECSGAPLLAMRGDLQEALEARVARAEKEGSQRAQPSSHEEKGAISTATTTLNPTADASSSKNSLAQPLSPTPIVQPRPSLRPHEQQQQQQQQQQKHHRNRSSNSMSSVSPSSPRDYAPVSTSSHTHILHHIQRLFSFPPSFSSSPTSSSSLTSPSSSSPPQSASSKKVNIAVGLDGTLVTLARDTRGNIVTTPAPDCITVRSPNYGVQLQFRLVHGAEEFIKAITALPNVRLAIFSGGKKWRNDAVAEALMRRVHARWGLRILGGAPGGRKLSVSNESTSTPPPPQQTAPGPAGERNDRRDKGAEQVQTQGVHHGRTWLPPPYKVVTAIMGVKDLTKLSRNGDLDYTVLIDHASPVPWDQLHNVLKIHRQHGHRVPAAVSSSSFSIARGAAQAGTLAYHASTLPPSPLQSAATLASILPIAGAGSGQGAPPSVVTFPLAHTFPAASPTLLSSSHSDPREAADRGTANVSALSPAAPGDAPGEAEKGIKEVVGVEGQVSEVGGGRREEEGTSTLQRARGGEGRVEAPSADHHQGHHNHHHQQQQQRQHPDHGTGQNDLVYALGLLLEALDMSYKHKLTLKTALSTLQGQVPALDDVSAGPHDERVKRFFDRGLEEMRKYNPDMQMLL